VVATWTDCESPLKGLPGLAQCSWLTELRGRGRARHGNRPGQMNDFRLIGNPSEIPGPEFPAQTLADPPCCAAPRSSCSKADAMRSISALFRPCRAASSLHFETALPIYFAMWRALPSSRSKYPATSTTSAREAVLSSSLIAVLRMRGLMSVGTGLRL